VPSIGETILQQLGGVRSLAPMIGVRHAVIHDCGVGIRFTAKARRGVNHLDVKLDRERDTYTVAFWRIGRLGRATLIKEVADVYASSLRTVIESETGLFLSM